MIFQRFALKDLESWKSSKNRKPLIVRGARQVGKTTLIREFARQSYERAHYFNFEKNNKIKNLFEIDLDPERILGELSFLTNQSINPERDLVIFDEIQACPKALTSLKYFCEDKPQLALIAAGSLLGLELSPSSYPVGKVNYLDLWPMNFFEFAAATNDQRSTDLLTNFSSDASISTTAIDYLWDRLKWYYVVGGLPEAVRTYTLTSTNPREAADAVRAVQQELLRTYLADMAKHSGKQNSMHLERLFLNIPTQLTKEENGGAPKFRFRDAVPGLKGYERLSGPIDWLEKAGLILRLQIAQKAEHPLVAQTKENTFKLFIFDVGMLGCLSELSPVKILSSDYGSYKGYFAENFVLQELKTQAIGPIYSWRENTAEIEFLAQLRGDIIPIEVKSGFNTRAKSLNVYNRRYNPKLSIVLNANRLQLTPTADNKCYIPLAFSSVLKTYLEEQVTKDSY